MGIKIGNTEIKKIYMGSTEIKKVYLGNTQVRPVIPPYLCFTAEQAGSRILLEKNGSPTAVSFETSTDGINWSDYTLSTLITLTNVGDKVYFRNKSETPTRLSLSASRYYHFSMGGKIAGSGDVNYLLCKNSTDSTTDYCFYNLFYANPLTKAPTLTSKNIESYSYYGMFSECNILTTAPQIIATTLSNNCCGLMFYNCTSLVQIPKLPAKTLSNYCYYQMFKGCSSLKLKDSQDSDYTQAYMIPDGGSGTTAQNWNNQMFYQTGGSFTSAPAINTTYYVHKDNTIV